MRKLLIVTVFMLTILSTMLFGCYGSKSSSQYDTATLKVSVFYRERIMLPPHSTVSVTLEDVSKMDVKADIITNETITPQSGPPYAVQLKYDPASISEHNRYAVRARIENSGTLLFINDTHIDPFAGDSAKPVEILVKRVAH